MEGSCFWSAWQHKMVCSRQQATESPLATSGTLAVPPSVLLEPGTALSLWENKRSSKTDHTISSSKVLCDLAETLDEERNAYSSVGAPSSTIAVKHDAESAEWPDEAWSDVVLSKRSCRESEGRLNLPSWAAGSKDADKEVFRRLPGVLRNRTMVFVGDSVSELLFIDLSWAVERYADQKPVRSSGFQGKGSHCASWTSFAFSVCIQQAARVGGLRHVPDPSGPSSKCSWQGRPFDHDLESVLACLAGLLPGGIGGSRGFRPSDVLVVNTGVHHNTPSTTLAANVRGMVQWYERQSSGKRPALLWRETLPTHFVSPSHNGEYSPGGNLKCGASDGHCVASADPIGRTQKFNRVSSPIVEAAALPIIRAHNVTSPLWDMHNGCLVRGPENRAVDCVHYPFPSPVLRYVNILTLAAVEEIALRAQGA